MTTPVTHSPAPVQWATRLARRVRQHGDCWVTTKVDQSGYGTFAWSADGRRRYTSAHRAAWLAHRSDLPEGVVLDHLCRNRACCNPWHLEVVTDQVNIRRGAHAPKVGRSGRVAGLMHQCTRHGRGDGYLAITPKGHTRWICRVCRRARKKGYQILPPVSRSA